VPENDLQANLMLPYGRTIVRALEQERSRIARDLHAGAGQPLAGIKLNLEILNGWADVLPVAGREALARLQALADQALAQVRAVSHHLHPPDWQGLTAGNAIRHLMQSSGLTNSMHVDLDIREFPVEPSHAVKIAIYRCTQECISNVARHSGATRFALSLMAGETTVELRLEDNGRGFPKETAIQETAIRNGIGLISIREHTDALGGLCDISSGENGVRIRVQLPLEAD
jgi:two-component system NarL family sensor kinase